MFDRIFHQNIVVSDLDRSLEFYCGVLGMKILPGHPFDIEGDDLREGFGLMDFPVVKCRGAFVYWGDYDDPALSDAPTFIDLLEFIEPRAVGEPYSTLRNIGIARTALKVNGDIHKVYDDFVSKGVKFVSPLTITNLSGIEVKWCCFYDPDGTVLEIFTDKF